MTNDRAVGGAGEGERAKVGRGAPRVVYGYAVVIAVFHLVANLGGTLPTLWFNALHFALLGSLAFLLPGRGRDWVPAVLLFLGAAYLPLAAEAMHQRGEVLVTADRVAAVVTIVAALAVCRQTSGWVMPILGAVALVYVLGVGRYLDGLLHFRGVSLERVLYRFYFTDEGLFGFVATISATYVFMFILFSAFLLKSGAGEFVIRLAQRVTARLPGGGGYVAVLASGLTGTINGSAIANTVATGSITIPLMKRYGFSGTFAAGLEAAASTGGQILPPVMGAGAFIIAQYTGLPYSVVIGAALLPALLYFFSLMVAVWLETRKLGLPAIVPGRLETAQELGRAGLPFVVPLGVLVTLLLRGYSPAYAAGAGIVAIAVLAQVGGVTRMGWRAVVDALALGSRLAAPTATLLIASGLVIGALNLTGSGVALAQLIVGWSGGSLLAALVLVAGASLILGLGLPVTAAYAVMAVVAVPALEELGVAVLAAHLIVFWFSQDSNVTPPVCLAAFAAAGIAGSPPFATGMTAWRLAKALYLVPLLFAYRPLITGSWDERLVISGFAAVGLVLFFAAMAGVLRGPLGKGTRVAALVAAVACGWPDVWVNVAGAVALPVLWWSGRAQSRTVSVPE